MRTIDLKRVAKIKAYLEKHGHKPDRVDTLSIKTEADLRRAVCELHSVSEDEYRRATGK